MVFSENFSLAFKTTNPTKTQHKIKIQHNTTHKQNTTQNTIQHNTKCHANTRLHQVTIHVLILVYSMFLSCMYDIKSDPKQKS